MGVRSCGPLCSRVSRFFLRLPAFLFAIFFAFPCALAFLFRVPMLLCQRVYVWGVGVQLITRTLCVYGRIRGARSTGHRAITPLVTRAWCTSILAGSRFGVKLISCPHSLPSNSPLSTRHNCVISSQERQFSVPILCLPRSRAPAFLKYLERGNAKPGMHAHLYLCWIELIEWNNTLSLRLLQYSRLLRVQGGQDQQVGR